MLCSPHWTHRLALDSTSLKIVCMYLNQTYSFVGFALSDSITIKFDAKIIQVLVKCPSESAICYEFYIGFNKLLIYHNTKKLNKVRFS